MNKGPRAVRLSLRLTLLTFVCYLSTVTSAPVAVVSAPFQDERALRQFSDHLMQLLAEGKLESAQHAAVRNSHGDDAVAQQNISTMFASLRDQLADISGSNTEFVQTSHFGRSFMRHQYSLHGREFALRCMLTYRRKTDGWRLNQIWCR